MPRPAMPRPAQPRPAGRSAPSRPSPAADFPPAPPVTGPVIRAADGIADFLSYLTKQYDSAAANFPGTTARRENQTSRRP